jgi:hypothetical protein
MLFCLIAVGSSKVTLLQRLAKLVGKSGVMIVLSQSLKSLWMGKANDSGNLRSLNALSSGVSSLPLSFLLFSSL